MSVVTGIMVICRSVEPKASADADMPYQFDWLNRHLEAEGYDPLLLVDRVTGGGKHPQFRAAGGGYNYLNEVALVDLFMSLEWEFPENAVLILQPEDGSTRVVRPKGYRS